MFLSINKVLKWSSQVTSFKNYNLDFTLPVTKPADLFLIAPT